MSTPQTAIIPDHCQAGIYIEARVAAKQTDPIKAACRQSLLALAQLQNAFPQHKLGLTIAFGADLWRRFQHIGEGEQIKPFRPLGNGLCPATQCDIMLHIQSMEHKLNYALASQVLAAFGDTIHIDNEAHGFRLLENRGIEGFVDGTENPQGDEKVQQVGIIAEGKDVGGSYIVLQKYVHNLPKWNCISVSQQEACIGRSKQQNEEFSRAERLPDSHLSRTNLKENGVGLKIVRRSLPFGTVSGEHGLMFIAYCAQLHNIEQQLLSMFGETDGKTDLLLTHLTHVQRSAYYYAPSVERLQQL